MSDISLRYLNKIFYDKDDNTTGGLKNLYSNTKMIKSKNGVPRYSKSNGRLVPSRGTLNLSHFRDVIADSGVITFEFSSQSPTQKNGEFGPQRIITDGTFEYDNKTDSITVTSKLNKGKAQSWARYDGYISSPYGDTPAKFRYIIVSFLTSGTKGLYGLLSEYDLTYCGAYNNDGEDLGTVQYREDGKRIIAIVSKGWG